MEYNEYRELKNSIDVYLKTGNQQLLTEIQASIEKKEDLRRRIAEDLRRNVEYIQVFSTDDQIKIITEWISRIKEKGYFFRQITWMFPYVSDKALNEILRNTDNVVLLSMMNDIEMNIRAIGNRFCDSNTYFWLKSTNVFTRMRERIIWMRLYRKCKKNLKK